MSGIGPAPVGPMAMKNVGDLQPRAAHGRRLRLGSRSLFDQWCEAVEWTGDGPDRDIGDARVKCRSVELGVAQKRVAGPRRLDAIFNSSAFSLLALNSAATAAERLRFWNLTGFTIKELHLAPTGTVDWGPDQCKNDPDGVVDVDERLTLKNVVPGHYDVKLVDKQGRSCVVRNVEVQAGKPYAFSLSEKDLTDCSQ